MWSVPRATCTKFENDCWKNAVDANQALVAEGKYKNVSMDVQPFGTVRFPGRSISPGSRELSRPQDRQIWSRRPPPSTRRSIAALKPGGVFFILDHQGAPGLTDAEIEKLHRINRDQVVKEVTSAGFKLAEEGSFLRRAGDDHTKPIFDKSIRGKTDQYALKFVKPR